MCRSCNETPDNQGRRCQNRQDGFSPAEADQRTRSRGLNGALAAIGTGDHQAAANALSRAVAAQRNLDGSNNLPPRAPVPEGPYREVFALPSDLNKVRAHLDNLQADRARRNLPPLNIDIASQIKASPVDGMLVLERVKVRVSGDTAENLEALPLGNYDGPGEEKLSTHAVMAVAHAITRATGRYVSKAEGGDESTAAMVSAYIAAGPDSDLRNQVKVTQDDRRAAFNTVSWSRKEPPTSDYERSVHNALSSTTISYRQLATGISAIPIAERAQQRKRAAAAAVTSATTQQTAPAPQSAPNGGQQGAGNTPTQVSYRPRPGQSVWLGEVGQRVYTKGTVEKVLPTTAPSSGRQHFMHLIRTENGSCVKWFAPSETLLQAGDYITLCGTIAAHEEFRGEKQTLFTECDRPLIHNRIP